ncbi:MAG TPA: trypsin-like peptidase domain-containing protein [Actinomycetota bacterium]|nr:trypsin-like peptidase domain-containing protein [Actinomycetota bacterium]
MRRSLAALLATALLTSCAALEDLGLPVTGPTFSPAPPAPAGSDTIVRVVEAVRPAVVNVTTNVVTPGALTGEAQGGTGTGFIVDESGIIVTNFHVVEGGLTIRVITDDGRRFDARVIGGDPNADLAVLQVEADDLPTVDLGDSDHVRLGETVVALGFALALEGGPSVTSGIISAKGRTITASDPQVGERTYEDLLQTDAAINPGNSGGPLVDLSGRVVGINTAGVQAGAAENISFAIAINRAKEVIRDAIRDPEAEVAYIGVSTRTVDSSLSFQLNLPVDQGALVVDVAPGGPADRAGIRPGDIIIGIGGRPVTDDEAVRSAIVEHEPGERIQVSIVRRDGSRETMTVALGVRPLPIPTG